MVTILGLICSFLFPCLYLMHSSNLLSHLQSEVITATHSPHSSLHHTNLTHTVMKNEDETFMASIQKKPASVIEGVICFFSVWSILGLAGFHTYLTTSNQTTNEDVSHCRKDRIEYCFYNYSRSIYDLPFVWQFVF